MAAAALALPDSASFSATPALPKARTANGKSAQAQGQEFEAIFLGQVLNTISQGVGEKTGFDGGSAEQQWRSILNEHVGRSIAARGGIGIAAAVTRELLRAQEAR